MGRKAYTTYRNHTSSQCQFKTGVPQGGVLSPTLFNIYTADIPPPRAPVQVMAYADDITITSTHTSTSAAKKYIQPYQHKVFCLDKTKPSHTKSRQKHTLCSLQTLQNIGALWQLESLVGYWKAFQWSPTGRVEIKIDNIMVVI